MNITKAFSTMWVAVVAALLAGLVVGSLVTRWHYKSLYKNYVNCGGSISYYDKTGKVKLYAPNTCSQ